MKITTVLAATALSLLPALGFAMCDRDHQAQSCAAGMVWDAEQSACVKQVSS